MREKLMILQGEKPRGIKINLFDKYQHISAKQPVVLNDAIESRHMQSNQATSYANRAS
jgi:hypothetical protein